MEPSRTRRLIWVASILLGCLLCLAVGMAASRLMTNSDNGSLVATVDDLRDKLSAVEETASNLEADLKDQTSSNIIITALLSTAAEKESLLENEINNTGEELADTRNQLNQIQTAQAQLETLTLETQEIRSQYTRGIGKLEELKNIGSLLESHRLLLVELRKDQPKSRVDALSYWATVRKVANKADPNLASPADKIILRIDNFFDWTDREPIYSLSNSDQYADAYAEWQIIDRYTSGAVAYDEAVDNFSNQAMLSVINQLDSLVISLE